MKTLGACCIGWLLSMAALCAWPQAATPRAEIDTSSMRAPVLGDLRGKRCDEAGAALRKLHFALAACPYGARTGRYPADTINWQSLEPGTPASRLGTLRVALEPPPAPVATLPDLRGKTCDQARAELRRLGVALAECRPQPSSRVRYPARTINAQSHAPGTAVSRVDTLRVTYEPGPGEDSTSSPLPTADPSPGTSKSGPAAAALAAALAAAIAEAGKAQTLPDLRGMSCEQAQSALRRLHLTLAECVPGKAGSSYPAGTINAQSHAPGTPLARVDRLRARFEPAATAQPPAPPGRLPDVRGMTCAEALDVLARVGITPASCADGADIAGAQPGRINAQTPNPGATLPLALPLVLRVQPAASVIVPALTGLDEAKAYASLAASKLRARASGPEAARGRRVLTQSPQAGTAVAPGSPVEVGLGLSVPRLLGLDCAAASRSAAEYGHARVQCESVPAPSPDQPVGRVFEQDPAAGGPAIAAPAVIRVSAWAAQPVTVPDVRERALDAAVAALDAARLVARPDERRGERVVDRQSPAPGTVVNAGSSVELVTREVVAVPDVVGRSLTAAQSTLRESRLTPQADASEDPDDRVVQSQAPAAHAYVPPGSAVRLATKRFATVPDLVGLDCTEATITAERAAFGLQCNAERSWRVTVFGTPRIEAQHPEAGSRAEAATRIVATASAPLPPSARWLGKVSFTAVAGLAIAPLLALALWLAHRLWPPRRTPVVTPVVPPPSLKLRIAADAAPSVTLRPAPAAPRRATRAKTAWRIVADAGHVLLRGRDPSNGGDDDKH